ncbi:MAG TPA: glycosyltransferase, partial [Opitutaceae bacterium]
VPAADWACGLLNLSEKHRASWLAETWDRTVATVRDEKPSLFLGYLFPSQIEATAVRAISTLGVPTVNFYCDHIREHRDAPPQFSGFDLHWVPETRAIEWYRKKNWRHLHAPMPTWVPREFRSLPPGENLPPTFLGTADSLRADLLGRALQCGAEIDIRGSSWINDGTPGPTIPPANIFTRFAREAALIRKLGWRAPWYKRTYRDTAASFADTLKPHFRPAPKGGDEMFRVLRESRVALGINRYPNFSRPFSRPDVYSRLRDIEAPMAGACYLTEWTEDLPHWYEIGRDIETYRSVEELVDKLKMLESSSDRRRSLRENGQRRAANELTIGRSFEKITQALGLKP